MALRSYGVFNLSANSRREGRNCSDCSFDSAPFTASNQQWSEFLKRHSENNCIPMLSDCLIWFSNVHPLPMHVEIESKVLNLTRRSKESRRSSDILKLTGWNLINCMSARPNGLKCLLVMYHQVTYSFRQEVAHLLGLLLGRCRLQLQEA